MIELAAFFTSVIIVAAFAAGYLVGRSRWKDWD